MNSTTEQLEIVNLPPHVSSWSVAGIPGFIPSVLNRYQRNHGDLPEQFSLVACPQVEINALGGLPVSVRQLTDARTRMQHFTSCNKLYLVILLPGEDAEARRELIQKSLSWSEGYEVKFMNGATQLRFTEATEEIEDAVDQVNPDKEIFTGTRENTVDDQGQISSYS
ncbi:MAG: hypothetical protein WBN96_08350 [Gammaproteobacteria bacterium]